MKKGNNFFYTLLSIIGMYAAHTSPLYFATFAMPTILRAEGTSLILIGFLGYLMLPWAFKFLWAPLLDRFYYIPWGKRKTWMVPTQCIIVLLLLLLFYIQPSQHVLILFLLLLSISLFAATQDMASAAYVMEQLHPDQRRWGNYAQVIGTTLGSALGGALILFCYGFWGWKSSIACITLIASFFLVWILVSKESHQPVRELELPSLSSFWKRLNTRYLLYVCLIYRGCEGLVMGMQQPFLVDLHVPVDQIGLIMGLGNITVGLFMAGLTGFLLKPFRHWHLLALLGIVRSLVYFSMFCLAFFDVHALSIIFTVIIINMAIRLMEMVTLYTIFMKECSSHQAATDFSILVSGELIIYMVGISLSGYLAHMIGYSGLFLLGSLLSLPSVIISIRLFNISSMKSELNTYSTVNTQ